MKNNCLVSSVIAFVSLLLLPSCIGGLGDAPDIEAPVLTITSPSSLTYSKRSITAAGTWTDNCGVTQIAVYDKTKSASVSADVSIAGGTWTAAFTLDDGYHALTFTAYDNAHNTSTDSVKQLILFVDETAPEGSKPWYISRSSEIQTEFVSDKSSLKQRDASLSENKDYFQNVSFTVEGSLSDNISLSGSKLRIYNADTDTEKNILSVSSESTSPYAPSYTITNDMLAAADSSLSSGIHYLRFACTAEDSAGNSSEEINLGYAAWYPQSDIPHIIQSLSDGSSLSIPSGSTLSLDFFDDDSLSEIAYTFISSQDYQTIGSPDEAKLISAAEAGSSMLRQVSLAELPRDYSVTIDSGSDTSQQYLLLAAVCDGTSSKVWNARVIHVTVSDGTAPIAVIDSPAENSIPDVSSGTKLTISGYTYDKQKVNSVRIAWVPYGSGYTSTEQKHAAAVAAAAASSSYPYTASDGTKVWNCTINDAGTYESGNVTYAKQTFTLDSLDILADFTYGGTSENKDKFFVVFAVNSRGGMTELNYLLKADTSLPSITVTSPSVNMQLQSVSENFTLSCSASKTNGITVNKTWITLTDPADTSKETVLTSQNGPSASYTITAGTNSDDTSVIYRFHAADILGNESAEQRTVIYSTLPVLTAISSAGGSRTYKKGDTVLLTAVFSAPVRVTGTPKLVLGNITGASGNQYAAYTAGSGSDTLIFSYTVPDGAVSEKITCSSLIPDGGTIESAGTGTGNAVITGTSATPLENSKSIALDGAAPYITKVSVYGGTTGYFRTSSSVTAAVTTNEEVRVGGSPSLVLVNGTHTFTLSFISITTASGSSTLTFSGTVTSSSPDADGTYEASGSTCIPDASLVVITDVNGNSLVSSSSASVAGSAVIDRTAPSAPSAAPAAGSYNTSKAFTLTPPAGETGGTLYYSTNGGVSFAEYTGTVSLPLPADSAVSGTEGVTYRLTGYYVDQAGNSSLNADAVTVFIKTSFPAITALDCLNADGYLITGSTLSFRMTFADKVTATAGSYLTLSVKNKSGANVTVLASASSLSATVTYSYTVNEGDYSDTSVSTGVKVTGFTIPDGSLADSYGSRPGTGYDVTNATALDRTGIIVDAVPPAITAYTPASGGTDATAAADSQKLTTVTLVFSENIAKGKGTLTLKRTHGWYIPPVLTSEEFTTIINALSGDSADQGYLINGSITTPDLDTSTGQPAGPYRKITHGLVLSGSNAVPDTQTKFVLKFADSIDDTAAGSEVSNIRTALEKAGYASQTLSVTSSLVTVSNKTVTVKFPSSLAAGRTWSLIIPGGAFTDSAGNSFAGLAADSGTGDSAYTFASAGVAAPVVRVDRYSHGWGAVEPGSDGATQTVGQADTSTKPTGYARARIDCETPGAALTYTTYTKGPSTCPESGTDTDTHSGVSTTSTTSTTSTDNADFASGSLTASVTGGTSYTKNSYFVIGDGSPVTARKDYIAARADYNSSTAQGYEGVFKTVVINYAPAKVTSSSDAKVIAVKIQGCNVLGGSPTISGFPLHDADSDERFEKFAYKDPNTDVYYWMTYEIVSRYSVFSLRANYGTDYTTGYYGNYTYISKQQYYSN